MLSLYMKYQNLKNRLQENEEGQGLVEYALIIALISLVVLAATPGIVTELRALYGRIAAVFTGIQPTLPAN